MFVSPVPARPALLAVAAVWSVLGLRAAGAADAVAPAAAAKPKLVSCDLALSPVILEAKEKTVGVTSIRGLWMNIHTVQMVKDKPAAIVKEPAYTGKPMYGAFRVGDGPRNLTYFAVDAAPNFPGKMYVDRNQNGDLTDDGPGDWDAAYVKYGHRNLEKAVTVHASWGTPLTETESGDYTFDVASTDGLTGIAYYGLTGRTGSVALNGKAYPAVLGEGTADGLFTVPAQGDITRSPVILYLDADGGVPLDAPAPKVDPASGHTYRALDLSAQFQVDGHWYAARPTASGASLKVLETVAPNAAPVAATPQKVIAVGQTAPDFTVQKPDGTPLHLSDYKGKVVILDFWATWCGPCQAAMPGLEKLYQGIKDQGVVVLSLNVCDEKQPFDRWMAKHANTDYHFDFGFDPAGKGDNSVSMSIYNVYAIPAVFVITRDGKVAANITGGNEDQLTAALKTQGITPKAD